MSKRLGIDELRLLVSNFDKCNEAFNAQFDAADLLQLHTMWQESEWDIAPDRWSTAQIEAALAGMPPIFAPDGNPIDCPFDLLECRIRSSTTQEANIGCTTLEDSRNEKQKHFDLCMKRWNRAIAAYVTGEIDGTISVALLELKAAARLAKAVSGDCSAEMRAIEIFRARCNSK